MATAAVAVVPVVAAAPVVAVAAASTPAAVVVNDAFSRGLVDALKPAVVTADESIRSVMHSQQLLGHQLDRLAAAMSVFSDAVKLPGLVPYSEKLGNARKRLTKVASGLDKINARLEEIRSLVRKKEFGSIINSGAAPSTPTAALNATPTLTAASPAATAAGVKPASTLSSPLPPSAGAATAAGAAAAASTPNSAATKSGGTPAAAAAAATSGASVASSSASARHISSVADLLEWDHNNSNRLD